MTMAITSVGYPWTLLDDEGLLGLDWARLMARVGVPYGIADPSDPGVLGDFRVTAVPGERAVMVAPGRAFGHGVLDDSDSQVVVPLPAPSSGARFHLVVLRRDWAAGTSIVSVAGSADASIPPRERAPGVLDDQPLALVHVSAAGVVGAIRDLRVFQGSGGVFANDELVLSFLNSIGTQVQIGPNLWTRTLDSLGSPKWHREDRTEDTGWVDISRNSGWNFGFGQVRRIGGVVYYRISPSRVQWNAGANIGTVPAGFRPSAPHFAASTHPSSRGQAVQIAASGSITAPQASDGASGLTINGSYPAS